MNYTIRPYQEQDELGWLRCRVLAFLETAYFDDVYKEKETYENPAIELVAEADGQVLGLIDVECEHETNRFCSKSEQAGLAAMIWHIAVHPDYRRLGIAHSLVAEAASQARLRGIVRLEAWTRDDDFVNDWYRNQGFSQKDSYYHIKPTQDEIRNTGVIQSNVKWAHPVSSYLHYVGDDQTFLSQFKRVHECRRYDLQIADARG